MQESTAHEVFSGVRFQGPGGEAAGVGDRVQLYGVLVSGSSRDLEGAYSYSKSAVVDGDALSLEWVACGTIVGCEFIALW